LSEDVALMRDPDVPQNTIKAGDCRLRFESVLVSNVVSNMVSNVVSNAVSNVVSNEVSNVILNVISNAISNVVSNVVEHRAYGQSAARRWPPI
jgi:hypothetical protein